MNSGELSGNAATADTMRESPSAFRLWIARYDNWRPERWNDAPPQATALELIEDSSFSEEEARLFLEGFNSQMLAADRPLWAVAVPVVLRYDGDPRPGELIHGHVFDVGESPAASEDDEP
jgi:hypothetical protein